MSVDLLCLSEEDVRALLTPSMAVKTTEEVLRQEVQGKVVLTLPRKLPVHTGNQPRREVFYAKGCYLKEWGVAGYRLFSFFPKNEAERIPTTFDYIWVCDGATGKPFALISEFWMSCVRTGAEAAVAARYLARRTSRTVGLVGAGFTAQGALLTLAEILKIEEVRVASRSPNSRNKFAQEMRARLGMKVVPKDSVQEAVQGADLIILATSADEVLLTKTALTEGVFLASLGGGQEIDEDLLLAADKFVTDDWESCRSRNYVSRMLAAGSLTRGHLYAELGQVVAGTRPGRESDKERIVLLTQGIASADLALAFRVYEEAKKKGLGKRLTL